MQRCGGDIVSSVISKIPVEFHMRTLTGKKYNCCGQWPKLIWKELATAGWCRNILRAHNTTWYWKLYQGTQLIAGSNGKKLWDWTIRSWFLNSLLTRAWNQFNDCTPACMMRMVNSNDCIKVQSSTNWKISECSA